MRIRAGQQGVRLTVLVVAAVALATGCSAEAKQPSAELPPASSAAAEPTPELPPLGPEDFPVPDEARTKDEAGAEAFLRYYIDLLNRQIAVPAGQPLRELGPECNECQRIARQFDEAAEKGHGYIGGRITIDGDFGTAETQEGVNLSFFARITAGRVEDDSGTPVDGTAFAAERLPSAALLTWSPTQQGWLVKAMNFG
jgi:hypothetical protein